MASNAPDTDTERVVVNRYHLLDRIGQGAMGTVYLGKDSRLGKVVAVKFLARHLLNRSMCDRFATEALVAAQLSQQSRHIVDVTDYGADEDNIPFYVMEYLQGESLKAIMGGVPLALPRFLHLARQICLGLQVAHQGVQLDPHPQPIPIIHRDIKPSNIFVCPDPTFGELAKILDFGIAEVLSSPDASQKHYMGTLAYSSPEQLEGSRFDHRSDIYSLGVMMFEMLAGKLPLVSPVPKFEAWQEVHLKRSPLSLEQAVDRALPKALSEVVMACLAKSPGDRPASVSAILDCLTPLTTQHRFTPQPLPVMQLAEELSSKPLNQPLWPKDVPIQEVVIARPWSLQGKGFPAVWVMLPHRDIQTLQINRLYNTVYRTFLFAHLPHPALLWITAIYTPGQKTRWFRVFLDLKAPQGMELVLGLLKTRQYEVLFFDLEPPHCIAHTLNVKLDSQQYSELQHWVMTSRTQPATQHFNISKQLLNNAYQRLRQTVERDVFQVS